MSYEKAMKHHANVRKCKKQGNNYFGFDTGSGHWPSFRATEYGEAFLSVREWFRDRKYHTGAERKHFAECIKEQIRTLRRLSPKAYYIHAKSKVDMFSEGFLCVDGSWGNKKAAAKFTQEQRSSMAMPRGMPVDAVWLVKFK
jgi:hypothetical protein